MQENEFEKQLQQKMEELKITPSDAVWQKIEPQIRKEKRRRWLLIFLPVMLIGLLYGGYVLLNGNEKPQQVTKDLNEKNITAAETPQTKPVTNSTNYSLPLQQNKKAVAQTSSTYSNRAQKIKVKGRSKITTDQNISATLVNNSSPLRTADDTTKSMAQNERSTTDIKDPVQVSTAVETTPAITQATEPAKQSETDSAKNNAEIKNEKSDQEIVTPAEKKNTTKNKHPWNWGFSFATGVSGMTNSLFTSIFGDGQKSFDRQSNPTTAGGYTSGQDSSSSLIRSSYAFITGITAEKKISGKTIFTTGLNYKLFSTTNTVGTDSAAFFSVNNINKYHSYYHYIEIPVGIKFQVADLKKTKLFANTGFSISQLIGAKALQFNNTTRLYYHDNSLFNKTIIGFNAGLDLAIPASQRSFLIGPYFNYGLTKIAKEGYNKHHFTFIGLRAQYFFRKK